MYPEDTLCRRYGYFFNSLQHLVYGDCRDQLYKKFYKKHSLYIIHRLACLISLQFFGQRREK